MTGPLPESPPRRRKTGEMALAEPVLDAGILREQVGALESALEAKDRRISAMKEIGRSLGAQLNLDDVLALIMRHVTVLLDADRSTLYLVDAKSRELVSKVVQGDGVQDIRLPMGVGLAGWVAKSGQPLNLKDAYLDQRFHRQVDERTGYRTLSVLAVPMRDHRGNVLGVVQALNKKGNPPHFAEEDERTLEAVAPLAGTAIENAYLYRDALKQNQALRATQEELSRKLGELDLLFDFTQHLVRASGPAQIVDLGLTRAVDLTGAGGAVILRLEGAGALVQLRRARGPEGPCPVEAVRVGAADSTADLVGWVASRASPLIVTDAAADPRHHGDVDRRLSFETHSFCGVPLTSSDGAAMGSLCVANRPGGFTEEQLLLMTMLGNQVAKALEAAWSKERAENAQRLQAIGQMLSGIVHDFKTPLGVISGYVQLMAQSSAAEEREEFAEQVLRQFESLSEMTRDLLQFARGEVEVLLRKVYLQNFMPEVEELLRHVFDGSRVEVAVEQKYRGSVRMDPTRMSRVITNIARNAREAMPDGGTFTFAVEQVGESVLFTFSDSGPGIPEELEGRLFTEFATHGKEGGTGLGLAVVRRIVQEHHGDVNYESRPGQGTTFTVRLPL
jgi:signal transduction histidine kinase